MFNFLLKKINTTSQTITSAAIIIGALSLVSRLVGIFRDRILASEFGAGDALDVYYAAFRLPDFVYNLLILGAVSAGLIPVFTALLTKHKKDEAWRLMSIIMNYLTLGLIIICVVLFVLAPMVMPLITPGFGPEKMASVVKFSRIMFLAPIFLGLSAIFGSVLQSFRRFFMYSLAPVFYNLGIIIGALYLTKIWGAEGLAWGVVLGSLMHMIIQLLPLPLTGYRYRPSLDWRDKNARQVIKLMVPRTLALMVSQLNFVVMTILASTLAAGSLAIFNLANNLQSFPLGIFGISLAVAALPVLSTLAAEKKTKEFAQTISTTLRQVLFFIIPISVLLYLLRAQIVRVILGSGSFNWFDTRLTAACLAIFCLGLFSQGLFPLIIRGFYALQNTKTPFYAGLATMAINVAALFFFRWIFSFDNSFLFFTAAILHLTDLTGLVDFRVLALPASVSVSSIFELAVLLVFLRRQIGRLDGRKIFSSTVRILFASLGAGLSAYAFLQIVEHYIATETFLGILAQGLIAGVIGLAGYWALGCLFKMEEMGLFVASLKRKLWRQAKVVAEDNIGESEGA